MEKDGCKALLTPRSGWIGWMVKLLLKVVTALKARLSCDPELTMPHGMFFSVSSRSVFLTEATLLI